MLLNTILTNEVGKTLAHQNIGWEIFTYNFLNQINELYTNVIYLLLGNYAKKYAQKLDLRKQIIIQTSHPSPLS
ncbi:uracil-DNA glycosylase family protein, partial [Metamycoplasma equirhinis]|uniref:uracil-DNA glycosylase family protein n=1 Tax=Metamycoplasma equirhinis TaxID=92402 RepID=UPI003594138F